MPDKDKKFHEFALKSILFKGRTDWYYCYLKAEKIAHILALLSQRSSPAREPQLEELVRAASALPNTLAHFAAGEVGLEVLLADLFILLSSVRLCAANGYLTKENSAILVEQYEELAEKMAGSSRLSPFISQDDLVVPPLPFEEPSALPAAPAPGRGASGAYKGHLPARQGLKGQSSARSRAILEYIKKHKGCSIKDLSTVVTDCSEKTIQRELTLLIEQGLVRKEGDRRWSVYFAA
jgi:DNA-binding transcriptional ArsR family regulator